MQRERTHYLQRNTANLQFDLRDFLKPVGLLAGGPGKPEYCSNNCGIFDEVWYSHLSLSAVWQGQIEAMCTVHGCKARKWVLVSLLFVSLKLLSMITLTLSYLTPAHTKGYGKETHQLPLGICHSRRSSLLFLIKRFPLCQVSRKLCQLHLYSVSSLINANPRSGNFNRSATSWSSRILNNWRWNRLRAEKLFCCPAWQ